MSQLCARICGKSLVGGVTGGLTALTTSAFDKDDSGEVLVDLLVGVAAGAIFGAVGECCLSSECSKKVFKEIPKSYKILIPPILKDSLIAAAVGLVDGIVATSSQGKENIDIAKNTGIGLITGIFVGLSKGVEDLSKNHVGDALIS